MFDATPPNLPVEDILEKTDKPASGHQPAATSAPSPTPSPRPPFPPPPPGPRPPVPPPPSRPASPPPSGPRPVPPSPPAATQIPSLPAGQAGPESRIPSPADTVAIESPGMGWKRVLLLIIGAVALVVIVVSIGVTVYRRYAPAETATGVLQDPTPIVPVPTAAPEPTPAQAPTPAPAPEPVPAPTLPPDLDADGLSDSEEATLGTDPASADTDLDGLRDGDEVRIYQTDPKNPDTDGDTFPDGTEVRNGYNPKGSGKLFEVPTP